MLSSPTPYHISLIILRGQNQTCLSFPNIYIDVYLSILFSLSLSLLSMLYSHLSCHPFSIALIYSYHISYCLSSLRIFLTMNNLQYYLLPIGLFIALFDRQTIHPRIITLPQSNVVDALSGLVFRYLTNHSPADNIVSFTVAFPMTWDLCYLIPIKAFCKIPLCNHLLSIPLIIHLYDMHAFYPS